MGRGSKGLSTGLLALTLAVRVAIANPQGPNVVHGAASFANPETSTLQITSTPNAIINWQGFSIGANEVTRFVQESSASAVLNRVVGGDASAIYGQLLSNGKVFLVNPSGILFGPGAMVDTAGLVASTLQMTDADFLAGRLRFEAGPNAGSIENHGRIRSAAGGEVVLIAPSIENSGSVSVEGGQLVLAAGRKLTMTGLDTKGVAFEVQAPDDEVINLGELLADGGAVGAFAGSLQNRGLIRADSVGLDADGTVVLRASNGVDLASGSIVSASGPRGGQVHVDGGAGAVAVAGVVSATSSAAAGGDVRITGDTLELADGGRVDVSGVTGGGRALLGGERRDIASPGMPEARVVEVTEGARVSADASLAGDGGEVVVWGAEAARVAGDISARGGPDGGDGGFVETSAGGRLVVLKGPAVDAPAGRAGTWLIDPDDIRIVEGDGLTQNLGAPLFTSTSTQSVIGATLINEQLDIGSNILITTSGFETGTDAGDIVVDAALLKTTMEGGSTSLELRAHRDVVVNAPIGSTGERLSVILRGDFLQPDGTGSVVVNAPITTAGGSFTASAGDAVTLTAAVDTRREGGSAGSVSLTAGGNVALTGVASGSINAGTRSVSVQTGADGIFSLSSGARVDAGSLTAIADDVALAGPLAATGSVTLSPVTNARPVSVGAPMAGTLALDGGELGLLSVGSTLTLGSFSSGALTVGGPVSMAAVDNLTLRGSSISQGAGAAINIPGFFNAIASSGGPVTLGGGVTAMNGMSVSGGAVTVGAPLAASGGSVSVNASSFVQNAGAGLTASSQLNVTSSGPATYMGSASGGSGMSLSGTTTVIAGALSTGSGSLFVSANSLDLTGSLAAGGGGTVNVRPRSFQAVDLGGLDAPGTLGVSAAELDRMSGGTVEIGSTGTSQLNVSQPIAPSGISDLALRASGGITQAMGATVTVDALGLFSSFGDVIFDEANAVSTVAGSSGFSDQFLFGSVSPLTVGMAGGGSGISGSSSKVTLQADSLDILANVQSFGGTVTLRPRTVGNAVSLGGGDAPGVLGLTDAELDRVFADSLTIQADTMNVPNPVSWFGGSELVLAPQTAARPLSIGAKPMGELGFNEAELQAISAGLLVLGDANSGPVTTAADVTRSGDLRLTTGDMAGVQIDHALTANSDLDIFADVITFNMGGMGASLAANGGTIVLAPFTDGLAVDVDSFDGGNAPLELVSADLTSLLTADTLQIGREDGGQVTVKTALTLGLPNLAIRGSDFTQTGGAAIQVPMNLDVDVSGSIDAGDTLTSTSGSMSFRSNTLADFQGIAMAPGDITIGPHDFRDIELGAMGSPFELSVTAGMNLQNLQAGGVLMIGDFSHTNGVHVAAPINPGGASALSLSGFFDLTQAMGATITANELALHSQRDVTLFEANIVGTVAGTAGFGDTFGFSTGSNPLTVGTAAGSVGISAPAGSVDLRADSFNLMSNVSANDVSLRAVTPAVSLDIGPGMSLPVVADTLAVHADGIRISNPTTIGVDALTLAPLTPRNVDVVGMLGSPGGPLELLFGDLQNLSLNPGATVTLGDDVTSSDLTIFVPAAITAFDHLALVSSADISVDAALSLPASMTARADVVTFNAPVTAPLVKVEPSTPGMALSVAPALVNQVTATDLVLGGASTGAVTLMGPLAPPNVTNLELQGSSLAVASGQGITVGGSLNILADDVDLGAGVTSSGGGSVSIAPRAFNRQIDLGTETMGRLSLTAAELAQAATSGQLRIGDSTRSGSITVSAPVSAPSAGSLALASRFGITQAPGAPITASQLAVTSAFGSVTLDEPNAVGALAGTASGLFSFTGSQPLTVTTLNGTSGVSGSTVSLNADSVELLADVGRFFATVNLAPHTAGRGITLGAEVPGTLSFIDAELGRVVGNTLNIGTDNSGAIDVAAAVEPTRVDNVNLVSSGNTININAPFTVARNVDLRSDVINIQAALLSRSGSVTLQPLSMGRPVVIGAKASDALGLTVDELGLIDVSDFGLLTIGSSDAGSILLLSPLTAPNNLRLVSGAAISQSVDAPLSVEGLLQVDAFGPVSLPASNLVESFFGFVSGAGNDLQFNNLAPLRLQDVFGSAGSGGRVLITSGRSGSPVVPGEPVPPSFGELEQLLPEIIDLLLSLEDPEETSEKRRRLRRSRSGDEQESEQEVRQCS